MARRKITIDPKMIDAVELCFDENAQLESLARHIADGSLPLRRIVELAENLESSHAVNPVYMEAYIYGAMEAKALNWRRRKE